MKGDYPAHLNGDGSLKEEAKERRHWRAFWDEFPGWLRTAIVIAFGGTVGGGSMKLFSHSDTLMDEDDYRRVVKEEIGPLKAGFKAFVETQPDKVQVLVFRAMTREAERNADRNKDK